MIIGSLIADNTLSTKFTSDLKLLEEHKSSNAVMVARSMVTMADACILTRQQNRKRVISQTY